LSYLHATWERRDDIERVDQQGKNKIKRFMLSATDPAILGETSEGQLAPVVAPNSSGRSNTPDEFNAMHADEYCEDDIEYFNPNFVEVDRIISCDKESVAHSFLKSKGNGRGKKVEDESAHDNVKYLVKWQGLPHSDCTWEKWSSLKNCEVEVARFWENQKLPAAEDLDNPHPTVQQYQKLTTSPVFGDSSDETAGLELRDYQLEGLNWLLWNWWHHRPCILADEMGLGKTIQTIGFFHQLRFLETTNVRGPFIVVAPLSLIEQWQAEVSIWSPQMNCIMYHGSQAARELIVRHEFYFNEKFSPKMYQQPYKRINPCKFHILLTTYEIAIKDIRVLSKINWEVLLVDEAHRLKNPGSKLFEQLSGLPHKHCVLLTGTPLQNKTEELWALLNFADKARFGNQKDFVEKFGDLKDSTHVAQLHTLLKPYLLRRVKEDVEKSLPPKEETIIEVALTTVQKQFYRAIYERNTAFLFRGAKGRNTPSLMNIMMELRKCCNHPYLVRGVEERILSDIPHDLRSMESLYQKMIESSGKLVLLDKLLPRLHSQGHRVLIFSQMVKVLNILEDFLKYRGYSFERLDGNTRASCRTEAVGRFCKASSTSFVMLLSTRAGGLGLNLTAADTVIIFDSDWNPHNDIQAQARAHRIGQTKAVMVYRLLTRKTYG
jgi:SNF2 family DNA or RNA helicase